MFVKKALLESRRLSVKSNGENGLVQNIWIVKKFYTQKVKMTSV